VGKEVVAQVVFDIPTGIEDEGAGKGSDERLDYRRCTND